MKYCKKCVQPDTRPGIKFDKNGICYACKYQKQIDHEIDWDKREKKLRAIVKWAKSGNKGKHDCVIGVSGGKDSHFQALFAKEKLGLNCLLVNLAPDNITKLGAHNIENLIHYGFDTMIFRPNPKVWKHLIRYSFYKYGNPVKPTEYPLFAVSYITALKFQIPLLIQGENPGITLGVTEGLGDDDNALNINLCNTLDGGNATDWAVEGIKLKDLLWYQYPNKNELLYTKIKAIWLNYYVKEWSYSNNTDFAVSRGLCGREENDPNLTGRLNPYCALDAESLQIVNQMLKYYKLGFGFVTDEVCYYIREGRMSREEGIKQVEQYDGKCGEQYINEFCEYIGISVEEFWKIVDKFVNKELFRKDTSTGKWKPKFKVGYGLFSD